MDDDIDLSDDDSLHDSSHSHTADSFSPGIDENRRAHHNALERKRRDHIKDSFSSLKEVVPTLVGERSSRALILKKAVDYIATVQDKIENHEKDINSLKAQNEQLEAQIRAFEGAVEQEETEDESVRTLQQNDDSTIDEPPEVKVTVAGGVSNNFRTTVPYPVSRQ